MLTRLSLAVLIGVLLNAQDREAALNAHLEASTRSRTTALDDEVTQTNNKKIGSRLAKHIPGENQWIFALIRDNAGGSTHEPISLPGGYIFISTPLILAVENEPELAGMLAHAMSHNHEKRPTQLVAIGKSSIPLIFIGGGDDQMIPMGFRETFRANELEADRKAIKLLADAGYDPVALLRYIRRTQRDSMNSFLPPRVERIDAMEKTLADIPEQPSSEFAIVQKRVRGLIALPKKEPPTLRRK